ncbi:MAG TPA: flagellar biosynthetic protein FliR [Polyangia bacterium]
MALPDGIVTPTLFGFVMILFRTAAFCTAAPLYGMKMVPGRVRLGLSILVAYAAYAGAGFPPLVTGAQIGPLVSGAFTETVIGLSTGMAARFALDAASAAGQIIAASVGLSFGATVDPVHGVETTSVGEWLSMITLATMLSAGLHRELVAWVCRSVVAIPPGAPVEVSRLAAAVVAQAISAVALAVRMSFPVMAAVTFGHVALGVVGRTAPQLNISSVGFSITILAGGGALYMIAPTVAEMATRTSQEVLARGM